MKGEAIITIKDKNGKIKQQVKEPNLVFDIPKELIKQYISNADMGSWAGGTNNSSGAIVPISITSPMDYFMQYQDFFGSIRLNSEECSTTDYKDFKMPVIWGSEYNRVDSNNKRYSQYDTANSSMVGNVLKRCYTWNDCPAFTLKSINLGHRDIVGTGGYVKFHTPSSSALRTMNGLNDVLWVQNSWIPSGSGYTYTPNTIYRKGSFSWGTRNSCKSLTKLWRQGVTTAYSYEYCYYVDPVFYPAKNSKLLIKCYYNDFATDYTNQAIRYIMQYDCINHQVDFAIPIDKFDGLGSPSSYTGYYCTIIATEWGNYLFAKHNSQNTWHLYKLPTTYNGTDTISELNVDLSFIARTNKTNGIALLNEYVILNNEGKTLRINSDDTITVYNYLYGNCVTEGSYYNVSNAQIPTVVNRYQENKYYLADSADFPRTYNTTVLNLGTGVVVAQGDTVSIEYTITAN